MAGAGSIPGLEELPGAERAAVQRELALLQLRDSMETYNGLVQRCFNECVSSFSSKTLEAKEQQCVAACVRKFLAFSARLGQRFAEKNVGAS
ncbi:tim10/DDP zinc finger domain-containing protein, putative [Eimeria tenella]|uniref:Mitochondrial import inner membrane translocase subunit n=1 Tax=Eimeria tenella TaxID=5802 RepID=U6KSZ9_EIMTE|nr:tim10/DDP zinc finger domain-containing protein, putative [Eimeria tenella]CDJ39484.1 tim10/DDP zinc finger domain-containing protein, putative [Eimeria tenella]|eukprot:XP_013230239.1 tim10/DDP zinc finger domain-containing protein, putative [Eimeria tenella]